MKYILLSIILAVSVLGINNAYSATIEDIKSEITYTKVSSLGLDTSTDIIKLNVNNQFFAVYQNSFDNFFVFVGLESIGLIDNSQADRTITLKQQLQDHDEAIKELQEQKEDYNRNNNDEDDRDSNDNNNDDSNNNDDEDNNDEEIDEDDPEEYNEYVPPFEESNEVEIYA